MTERKLSHRWRAILLGITYFLLSVALIGWTRFGGGVAFIWVGNALLLAELSLQPRPNWRPAILACIVANAAANLLSENNDPRLLTLSLVNAAEAVLAARLLRRLLGGSGYFESIGSVAIFLGVTGVAIPALGGLVGAAVIAVAMHADYWANWLHWFAGRALGAIVVTPIALMVMSGEATASLRRASPRKRIEAALLLGMMAAVTGFAFGQHRLPLLFLPLLPLVIATFRLGGPGAGAAVAILAALGGRLTITGSGPVSLIDGPVGLRAEFFQGYLAVAVLMALPIAADLRQRRRLYLQLRDSEARYRLIADNMSDIVLHLTPDGTIRYASPSVRAVGGFAAASWVGRNAGDLVDAEDRPRAVAAHADALRAPGRTFSVEYRAPTATGELRWFETHTRAFADEDGTPSGVVSIIRDIHQRKTLQDELAVAASSDPLTGLANRRVFVERLDSAVAAVRAGQAGGCVGIFDIDLFKRVNDRHGHEAGDFVLQEIARIARLNLREGDLVARIGGEEFGLILPGADLSRAEAVCERLRAAIADHPVAAGEGRALAITISIGIAAIGGDAAQVLRDADRALYVAKAEGRDCLRLAA